VKTISNGIAKLRKDGSAINWTTLNARFGGRAEGERP
jgi:hypothetical protein